MTKNNTTNQILTESWASSISEYILQRREQTYRAYTGDHNPLSEQQGRLKLQNDTLFEALFIVLANQLEEGHTVLELHQSNDEPLLEGIVLQQPTKLYQWQVQIINILAAPLFERIVNDHPAIPKEQSIAQGQTDIFNLLDTLLTRKSQLWTQLVISKAEKAQLLDRLDLVKRFFDLTQHLIVHTDATQSLFASIDDLNKCLQQHPLFTQSDVKNSLSKSFKTNQPIVYHYNQTQDSAVLTIWLHRTWQAEYNLAHTIQNILAQQITPLDITVPESLNAQQVQAVSTANENAFSIITGGPGTGKTYTVAQLVIALHQAQLRHESDSAEDIKEAGESNHRSSRIRFSTDSASLALAAPTGKAAQRMQESLQAALDNSQVAIQLQEAKTIHRLLGIGRDGQPRYHADNPLGEDIIIVDEASMLGVELANYLVSAIKPGARLILLGDANQLAAVDAGAVLADLCRIAILQPIHIELIESRRFGSESGIGQLARQINQRETNLDKVWQLLRQEETLEFITVHESGDNDSRQNDLETDVLDKEMTQLPTKNSLSKRKILFKLSNHYQKFINKISFLYTNPIAKSEPTEVANTIDELMTELNKFRILTAGHHGEWGDHYLNNYLTQWHMNTLKLPLGNGSWFHGRPIMVLQNNYELGLFNGDIGICLMTQIKGEGSRLEVFFENKSQGIAVNLLNEDLVATAYAMTIHKSQGSEFDHVAITFDHAHARLLSKELIYTAVTRAKRQVTIISTPSSLEKAISTPTQRYTGLALQFEHSHSNL